MSIKKEDDELKLIENNIDNDLSLVNYIRNNIEVISRIVEKFPRNKKNNVSKKINNEIEIKDTAYKTLANHIQKKFPDYSVTPENLASIVSRVKKQLREKDE